MHKFEAAGDDALERVAAVEWEVDFIRQPLRRGGQSVTIEVHSGERAEEIRRPLVASHGVECRRMRNVFLHEVPVILGDRNVQAVAGDDVSLIHRVLVGMAE